MAKLLDDTLVDQAVKSTNSVAQPWLVGSGITAILSQDWPHLT